MSECCVDASIAVKWFIKGETLRHKALQLLRDSQAAGITLIAPPVFEAETDSVIQTRVVDGRTTLDVADRTLALLDTAPVAIITHPACVNALGKSPASSTSARFMMLPTPRWPICAAASSGQRIRCFTMR